MMTKLPDLTIQEIAGELGIHPESVRRLCRQGDLPFMYRAGGRWRGSRTELAAFKKAGGVPCQGRPRKATGKTHA